MIDFNKLSVNKNIIIATTPRSASSYFYRSVYDGMVEAHGNNIVEWGNEIVILNDKNCIETKIAQFKSNDKCLIAKIMLHEYKDFFQIHGLNMYENSQIIILYPRSDFVSHYTSFIITLYRDIVLENTKQYSYWNAWPATYGDQEIKADFVKNELKSSGKISNEIAKQLISNITNVLFEFKLAVREIKEKTSVVLELSYDDVYAAKNNDKSSLIWKNPSEKLNMFDDPEFVVNEIKKSVSSLGSWPK